MNKLDTFYESLIPIKLKDNPLIYRKAKVLTFIHLFLLLIGIVLILIKQIVELNDPTPLWPGVLAGFGLVYIFKKTGNLLISGNLLAFVWAIPLAIFVPETGGLKSDNLLWLIISPLSALLFANRLSGMIWIGSLLLFTFLLYHFEPYFQISNNSHLSDYYFISYFFLFLVIYLTVLIFESGQMLIIKLLTEQKAVLEKQKQEIARQNQELEKLYTRLQETNQELEQFVYAASHDLREPLRMIGMYTQLTEKRLRGKLDDSTQEFMGYITSGVSRMQTLLESLLQYSRLGKNEADEKDIDLNNTLYVVIHNLMAAMKETKAEITVAQMPTVRASSVEMIQLFQNLLANAIKFRQEEKKPEIKILVGKTPNGESIFSVSDNGIGIPKQHQERVFKIFERLNNRNSYDGSGIGLATCRKIILNAGGRIWLDSTEGVGTTFYFTLPMSSAN